MKEIGLRVALGAQARHVMRTAVGRPIVLLAVGSLLGLLDHPLRPRAPRTDCRSGRPARSRRRAHDGPLWHCSVRNSGAAGACRRPIQTHAGRRVTLASRVFRRAAASQLAVPANRATCEARPPPVAAAVARPSADSPRIGAVPCGRSAPRTRACPSATPSEKYRTRHRSICPQPRRPPALSVASICSRLNPRRIARRVATSKPSSSPATKSRRAIKSFKHLARLRSLLVPRAPAPPRAARRPRPFRRQRLGVSAPAVILGSSTMPARTGFRSMYAAIAQSASPAPSTSTLLKRSSQSVPLRWCTRLNHWVKRCFTNFMKALTSHMRSR